MAASDRPLKPPGIFNRDREWATLASVWERDRADLAFVVGRRRVGKSFVLSRFAREVGGVYYQATKRTEREQVAGLSKVIGMHFDNLAIQAGFLPPTWEAIFEFINRNIGDSRFLLVIDEFPYLVEAAPALPSIIQKFWDHDWQGSRIKLVLSGSYVSAMTRLEQADQPLYGRRTAKLVFASFPYQAAALFTPGYSTKDKLTAYGIFGHLPGNLSLQDPRKNLADNVSNSILDPAGRLADDAQHLLDAFLGDSAVYYSILEAIATGEHTWSGITSRIGKIGGSLGRPLSWLTEMGLIESVTPITEARPAKSRRTQYRVVDPYLRFWHRIVAPLVNRGLLGLVEPKRLWKEWVEPKFEGFMGLIFEEICRSFVRDGHGLPFLPLRVGEWWDASSSNQVDVVALRDNGDMLIGECKWGRVDGSDLQVLRRRASLVASELDRQPMRIYMAAFSATGKADRDVKKAVEAGDVLFFTGADLYAK